jgi:hypothetical protein
MEDCDHTGLPPVKILPEGIRSCDKEIGNSILYAGFQVKRELKMV